MLKEHELKCRVRAPHPQPTLQPGRDQGGRLRAGALQRPSEPGGQAHPNPGPAVSGVRGHTEAGGSELGGGVLLVPTLLRGGLVFLVGCALASAQRVGQGQSAGHRAAHGR